MDKNKQTHEFSSTQVNWPKPAADQFTKFAAKIPDNDLYLDPEDPSFGREEIPHVTVKYGLHTSDPDKVKNVVLGTGPISVEAGAIEIFNSEKYDVIVVKIKSPGLHKLNEKISKHLEITDTHPIYKPHLTIAYVKPGCGDQYDGDTRFNGILATFSSISFSAKDGKVYQIPLEQTDTKFTEALRMTIADLMAKVQELRKKYQDWKQKHPEQESEEMINELLLLKEKLAERGIRLPKQDTPLDRDAEAFEKRVKIMPFVPEPGKVFKFTDSPYAPVHPSGDVRGSPISLSDFESHFRNFLAASPVIWAVGGIVEHDSTVNDCDILCSFPTEEEMQRIVDFRLFRMLPENIAHRASFLHERRGSTSPFTDCLPLYRLKLERIPDAEIIRMSESELSFAEITLRAKGAAKLEHEANISMREDRVELGRYFKAMKPYKIAPPLERQSVDAFLAAIEKEGVKPGWFSSRKADGFRTTVHIKKGKLIRAYSDDGIDNIKKFPQTAAEAKDLWPKMDLVLDLEVEWIDYAKKYHFPREVAASYLRRKGDFDDSHLTLNVFDCLLIDGKDIHNEPFSERWRLLKKLNFPQSTDSCPKKEFRFNLIPHYSGQTIEEIRQHTKRVSDAWACFPKNELLQSNPGFKTADSFRAGDSILCPGGYQKVTAVTQGPFSGNLITVKSRLFPFTVTENHPIRVVSIRSKKNKKGTIYLKPNSWYFKQGHKNRVHNFSERWKLAGVLDANDFLVFPKFKFEKPTFFDIGTKVIPVDRDLAYFLGWYLAEGSCTVGHVKLDVSKSDFEKYIHELRTIVFNCFGKFLRVRVEGRDAVRLYFCSKAICKALRRELGPKALFKRIPECIFHGNKEVAKAFLLAYLRGDGSTTHRLTKFYTSSETIARQLVLLLSKIDILASVWKVKQAGERIIVGRACRVRDTFVIQIPITQVKRISDQIELTHKNQGTEFWETDNNFYFRTKKIEKEYVQESVINIETESHLVLTPVITHNSEGNVCKKTDSIHTLTGKRVGWIKLHRTSLLYGLVTDVFETKTEGVFNIEWSVDPDSYPISKKNTREVHGKKFLLGGKTFATTLEPKIGKDIIQIELETLNFIRDKRSGTYDISGWAPRFLRIATDRKTPDSVADAVKRAIKNRVYQEKIIKADGSVEYLSGASAEEFPSKIQVKNLGGMDA